MCNKSCKLEVKKISVVLYECFENALICIISTSLLARFTQISNFSIFRQIGESLELLNIVFGNSLPKGIFWQKKKKFEFLQLSTDSGKLLTTALKFETHP